MSTLKELFAPRYVRNAYNGNPDAKMLQRMAHSLGVDSLRYLPARDLGQSLGVDQNSLCLGCVTQKYPTRWGGRLYKLAVENSAKGVEGRTYA